MKRLLALSLLFCASASFGGLITSGGGGGGGGATISSTTNLLQGDGAGNGTSAGFAASDVTRLGTASTKTTDLIISGAGFGLSGNITAPSWTTSGIRYKNVAGTLTDSTSTGTVATEYTSVWGGNTIAATNATTFTNYFSEYIKIPTAGTNVTFTNGPWAMGADNLKVGTSNQFSIGTTGHVTAEGVTSTGATGTGNLVFAISPTFTTPALGTPSAINLSNATALPTSALASNVKVYTITATVDGGGSAITTGKVKGFYTCPYSGTITGYSIAADTGTATVKTWKVATGTAVPTVSNNISTSGVSLSSGTAVRSATVSDFTTTTVTAGDIFAFNISAVSSATELTFELEITRN